MDGDDVSWDGDEWWAEIAKGSKEPHPDVIAGCTCRDCVQTVGHPATTMAMKLLVTHLTPLELECFSNHRFVPVTDSNGLLWQLFYDDAPSSSANLVGQGRLCWYPGRDNGNVLPKGDIILGQKYALETGAYYNWRGGLAIPGMTRVSQEPFLHRGSLNLLRFWKE